MLDSRLSFLKSSILTLSYLFCPRLELNIKSPESVFQQFVWLLYDFWLWQHNTSLQYVWHLQYIYIFLLELVWYVCRTEVTLSSTDVQVFTLKLLTFCYLYKTFIKKPVTETCRFKKSFHTIFSWSKWLNCYMEMMLTLHQTNTFLGGFLPVGFCPPS